VLRLKSTSEHTEQRRLFLSVVSVISVVFPRDRLKLTHCLDTLRVAGCFPECE